MESLVPTVEQLLNHAKALLARRYSPLEALSEMDAGALVIDIRGDEQQRADGLIPQTLVIRRNVLEWRCDPVSPWCHPDITDHRQKIILFCNEGYQSVLAAANLQLLGLIFATDLEGGFTGWKAAGLPTKAYDLDEMR